MAKRPTLADVAARAGVSVALVSIAMRGAKGVSAATSEQIFKAAQEIGYRPDARARLLRSRRSHLLGVQFGLSYPFHADLVEALYAVAEPAGYQLALSAVAASRGEQRATEALLDDRCEALILLGPQAPAARLEKLAAQLPVICLARRLSSSAAAAGVDVVRTADDDGARQAVDHLVSLGHRDIVHIAGGRAPGAADRRRGYRSAMHRHGLPSSFVPGGLTEQDGAAAARGLLAAPSRPTAVLAFNDQCATGVLDVFLRSGIGVPGQVSVIGFDDSRLARLTHINLTTVGQDIPRLADLAVVRALARLEGQDGPGTETVVPPRLIVRGTTAAPEIAP
jgi:DNA-binding LacI/PurR family transcriptional regulator